MSAAHRTPDEPAPELHRLQEFLQLAHCSLDAAVNTSDGEAATDDVLAARLLVGSSLLALGQAMATSAAATVPSPRRGMRSCPSFVHPRRSRR
jgi:hypothetical protein